MRLRGTPEGVLLQSVFFQKNRKSIVKSFFLSIIVDCSVFGMIYCIQNKRNGVNTTEPKYSAPAVEKMLSIIELLAASDCGYSINEIARLTSSPVNTVYRICGVLSENGYLVADSVSGHYVIGSKFYVIGKAAERRMTLNNVARPVLERLMHETGESVQLLALRGQRALILQQVETDEPIRIHVETCSTVFPHCSAAAKCILAFLDENELDAILPEKLEVLTENTVSLKKELKAELSEIRKSFVSFDREEYMRGLRCVGAPIFSENGKCTAGIDVMFPVYRVNNEKETSFVRLVKRAAEEISILLGSTVKFN